MFWGYFVCVFACFFLSSRIDHLDELFAVSFHYPPDLLCCFTIQAKQARHPANCNCWKFICSLQLSRLPFAYNSIYRKGSISHSSNTFSWETGGGVSRLAVPAAAIICQQRQIENNTAGSGRFTAPPNKKKTLLTTGLLSFMLSAVISCKQPRPCAGWSRQGRPSPLREKPSGLSNPSSASVAFWV